MQFLLISRQRSQTKPDSGSGSSISSGGSDCNHLVICGMIVHKNRHWFSECGSTDGGISNRGEFGQTEELLCAGAAHTLRPWVSQTWAQRAVKVQD